MEAPSATCPAATSLRAGVPVRVAQHGDCILRIAITGAPDRSRPP